jgi:transposase InsO family protein
VPGSAGWAGSDSSSRAVTNGHGRASSCTSTSRSSAGSSEGAGKRWRDGKRQHYTGRYTDAAGRVRRKAGWEFVHIAVDDYSRLAYAEVLPDERATTAVGFLRRAVAYYRHHGIHVERLLTDNGSAYISAIHALACRRLGIRHLRTRPRRPQTNGKAERFIRTLLCGWAYGAIYASSNERTAALDGWLWH